MQIKDVIDESNPVLNHIQEMRNEGKSFGDIATSIREGISDRDILEGHDVDGPDVETPDVDGPVSQGIRDMAGSATLMLDQGGEQRVTVEDLKQCITPPATATHCPIDHYEFTQNTLQILEKLLRYEGFTLDDCQVALHKEDQQLFGTAIFRNGREDIQLAIAFRNSHDKTFSAGVAIGGRVFICSNLCISGLIQMLRKHTSKIKDDLRESIMKAVWDIDKQWNTFQSDVDTLRSIQMDDDTAYETFGVAYGRKILSSQQFTKAIAEWHKPSYDHGPKSLWRWNNACTQIYKTVSPANKFKRHRQLHDFTMDRSRLLTAV